MIYSDDLVLVAPEVSEQSVVHDRDCHGGGVVGYIVKVSRDIRSITSFSEAASQEQESGR